MDAYNIAFYNIANCRPKFVISKAIFKGNIYSWIGFHRSDKADTTRPERKADLIMILIIVVVSLVLYPTSGQVYQCLPNLMNIAVFEGQQNTIMNLSTDPNNVKWTVRSTSDELSTYIISNFGGVRDSAYSGLYDINQAGLVIKNATTSGSPISTAGLYIGQCANTTAKEGAKLLVVRTHPQCSCVPLDYASNVTCNFTYEDSTIHPIYPIVTWKLNGVCLAVYTLSRTRVSSTAFYSESTITNSNGSPGEYTCELSFAAPTDIQFAYVATNAPVFDDSCSTPVCGGSATAELTSTIPPSSNMCAPAITSEQTSLRLSTYGIISTTGPPKTFAQTSMRTTARSTTTSTKSTSGPPKVTTQTSTTTLRMNTWTMTTRPVTTTSATQPHVTTGSMSTIRNGPISTTKLPIITSSSGRISATSIATLGQQSNSSLTRRPTNTASVAGANNITLECSSRRGTEAIRWSFTPFGGNETIWISIGSQLLIINDPQYILRATVNSSVLIVRQLSNLTEGTYSCYDGLESTSALLLVTPLQISMEPLFGPIAGGTNISIIGSSTIDQILTRVGSYVPDIKDVRKVYIGYDLSSTIVLIKSNVSSAFELVAVTPNTTEASIGQPLPIIFGFPPTPFNLTFNRTFTYRPNPDITALYPNEFIVDGGTLLDVSGHGFSSVAKPIIQLTVFIYRSADNTTTSIKLITTSSTSRICTVPPGSDTLMQCPMPPLSLTGDFLENLNSLYNYTSTTRVKRDVRPSDCNGVLLALGANGTDRACIYMGFILDGYKKYENINDVFPNTRLIFYSAPEINSSKELLEFDPSEDELIFVKGRNMLRGCSLRDYQVRIGNETCTISELSANQLSCRPPKEEPSPTLNYTIDCGQHLSVMITVGNKQYQYSCLSYTNQMKKVALIVGLTVGLAAFALFIVIIIICILKCRGNKVDRQTDGHQHSGIQELRDQHKTAANEAEIHVHPDFAAQTQDYDTQLDSHEAYVNILHMRPNTLTMYKPYDDYLQTSSDVDRN